MKKTEVFGRNRWGTRGKEVRHTILGGEGYHKEQTKIHYRKTAGQEGPPGVTITPQGIRGTLDLQCIEKEKKTPSADSAKGTSNFGFGHTLSERL